MATNLLFSVDEGYVQQLLVTLYSIYQNGPGHDYQVYLLSKEPLQSHDTIFNFCQSLGIGYHPIVVPSLDFDHAPTTDRYPETIYYRLLAHEFLPQDLDRILYLDADILCINDIDSLYQMDMDGYLYAAASHVAGSNVNELVNKIRLGNPDLKSYVNSGVLLMNLPLIRQQVDKDLMMAYIKDRANVLFLPDQDVLNALYGHTIALIDDQIYNFDVRYRSVYRIKTGGVCDLDWIMANTVFLHFCGRDKPWKKSYRGSCSGLYKHYQSRVQKLLKQV
ncbi:TPA: glycosyltransferase family 8 protein [Streptococcus suis]